MDPCRLYQECREWRLKALEREEELRQSRRSSGHAAARKIQNFLASIRSADRQIPNLELYSASDDDDEVLTDSSDLEPRSFVEMQQLMRGQQLSQRELKGFARLQQISEPRKSLPTYLNSQVGNYSTPRLVR